MVDATTRPRKRLPERKAETTRRDCTQSRLATTNMYTDDPFAIVVGAKRGMRLLQAWHTVTSSVNLTMARIEKNKLAGM